MQCIEFGQYTFHMWQGTGTLAVHSHMFLSTGIGSVSLQWVLACSEQNVFRLIYMSHWIIFGIVPNHGAAVLCALKSLPERAPASAGKLFKGDISVEGCPDISGSQVEGWVGDGDGVPRAERGEAPQAPCYLNKIV